MFSSQTTASTSKPDNYNLLKASYRSLQTKYWSRGANATINIAVVIYAKNSKKVVMFFTCIHFLSRDNFAALIPCT